MTEVEYKTNHQTRKTTMVIFIFCNQYIPWSEKVQASGLHTPAQDLEGFPYPIRQSPLGPSPRPCTAPHDLFVSMHAKGAATYMQKCYLSLPVSDNHEHCIQ